MRKVLEYDPDYREEIVKPLMARAAAGDCTTIVAARGAGLGPLFSFLRTHPSILSAYPNALVTLVNLKELTAGHSIYLLKEVLRELKNVLVEKLPSKAEEIKKEYIQGVGSESEQEVIYRIKNLLGKAVENETKIVGLLQEFDDVAKSNSPILHTIYSLYYAYKPHLSWILGVHSTPIRLRPEAAEEFDYIFHDYLVVKPFETEVCIKRYQKGFAAKQMKLTTRQLNTFYEHTGGLAAYNRYLYSKLQKDDAANFESSIKNYAHQPQAHALTKRLLADLTLEEINTLKLLAKGNKPDTSKLEYLKELGIVNTDNQIFARTLRLHLQENISPKPQVNLDGKRILINGIDVTPRFSAIEFKFLQYLSDHKSQVCDREDVIQAAWGNNPEGVSDEAVDQLVTRLRAKLEELGASKYLITTVRGRGFILG